MKECLVIVFMLSLTGMVVGQQQGSQSVFENNRTDSTRVTSPPPSLSTSRTTQTDSVERIMKLDIDANMIDAIKSGQTLEARIDLQDVTNGIVMMFDDPTTLKPRVDEVPRNLEPDFVSGNGVLHFTLDEVGLERLKTEGLQYEYRPGEMGNYQQVALKFVPSSSSARTPISDNLADRQTGTDRLNSRTDNVFGGDRQPIRRTNPLTRDDFDTTAQNNDQDRSLNTLQSDNDRFFEQQRLLDRQREIDRQEELARQREANYQEQLARQRELNLKHQIDTTRTFGIDRKRDDQDQNWSGPRLNRDMDANQNTHNFQLTDQDIDALATSTHQIRTARERHEAELELMRRKALAAEQRALTADADRARVLNQLRSRTSVDQTSFARRRPLDDGLYTSYGQRTPLPSDRDLNRSSILDPLFGSGVATAYPDRYLDPYRNQTATADATRLQLTEAALENERLRLQLAQSETDRTRLVTQNRLADRRNNPVDETIYRDTNQQTPLRMSDYGASIPGSQQQNNRRTPGTNPTAPMTSVTGTLMTETAVDHILRSYDGAHLNTNFQQVANRVKGEVAAISAAKTRADKFNGFLLFLFITFFALSLYLGWLAQSFYGQYGELADELRDTFTATT